MSFNEMKVQVESTRADWENDLKRLGQYWIWNYVTLCSIFYDL
jgi:hypothetical protein